MTYRHETTSASRPALGEVRRDGRCAAGPPRTGRDRGLDDDGHHQRGAPGRDATWRACRGCAAGESCALDALLDERWSGAGPFGVRCGLATVDRRWILMRTDPDAPEDLEDARRWLEVVRQPNARARGRRARRHQPPHGSGCSAMTPENTGGTPP